jgi:hypothetical protein
MQTKMWLFFVELITEIGAVLVAILFGLLAFKNLNRFESLLFFTCLLWVIFYCVAYLVAYLQPPELRNNHWVHNVYMLMETSTLIYAIRGLYQRKILKRLAMAGFLIFIFVYFWQLVFSGIGHYAYRADIASSIVMSVLCITVLFEKIVETNGFVLSPDFWILLGLLVYFGCSVPFVSLFSFISKQPQHVSSSIYHLINDNLSNIRYSFLCFAFLMIYNKKRAKVP